MWSVELLIPVSALNALRQGGYEALVCGELCLAVVHQASNERSLMSGLLALKFHVLLTTQKSSSNLARSRSGLMAY